MEPVFRVSRVAEHDELGARLGVPPREAWRLIERRRIEFFRVGRRVLVSEGAVQRFIEAHTVAAVG